MRVKPEEGERTVTIELQRMLEVLVLTLIIVIALSSLILLNAAPLLVHLCLDSGLLAKVVSLVLLLGWHIGVNLVN